MNMTNDENAKAAQVWQAALAGLLHDVGKFSQRAGEGLTEIWDEQAKQDYGYQHALASWDYVKKFVPQKWHAGLSGVAYHHRPKSLQDRWVQLADWMSSQERERDEDTRIPYLRAIFSRVNDWQTAWYWPLRRLSWTTPREQMFPVQSSDNDWRGNTQSDYARLWNEFETACRQRGLSSDADVSLQAWTENLLAVLNEFTWCVPSAFWNNTPDVSLFDHARTTAALAACLAADERDEEWCKTAESALRENRAAPEVALLIGGDLSGIQSFIYTISSGGAAKSLRARSFYIELLCQVVAYAILDVLNLPLTNLLYIGGGNFTILAPLNAETRLETLTSELANRLMETHHGEIGLVLAGQRVRADEFGQFNAVYDRLRKTLNQKKRQPFAQAESRVLATQIGTPLTMGGEPDKFCRVTGDDWELEQREGEFKTKFVWSLEELGKELPNVTNVVLQPIQTKNAGRPLSWREGLASFGYDATVVSSKTNSELTARASTARVWRLDVRNIHATKNDGLNALEYALLSGQKAIADLLISHGAHKQFYISHKDDYGPY